MSDKSSFVTVDATVFHPKWGFSVCLCCKTADVDCDVCCVLQGHSWLHGSRSPPEGHSVRQQRRLVLLRLHALQTPAGVTTPSSLFYRRSLLLPCRSILSSFIALQPLRPSPLWALPLTICGACLISPVWLCVFWSEVCKCQRSGASRSELR